MRWETVTGRQWLRLSEKRHSPSCEAQTEPSQAPQSCPDPQLSAGWSTLFSLLRGSGTGRMCRPCVCSFLLALVSGVPRGRPGARPARRTGPASGHWPFPPRAAGRATHRSHSQAGDRLQLFADIFWFCQIHGKVLQLLAIQAILSSPVLIRHECAAEPGARLRY